MEFRLVYEGALKAKATPKHKHEIRKALHPRLKELWQHPPLVNVPYFLIKKGTAPPARKIAELVTEVGPFSFASLVDSSLGVIAELEVVILKPEGPGSVVRQGGDLDNQLKTLFDALREASTATPRQPFAKHTFGCRATAALLAK